MIELAVLHFRSLLESSWAYVNALELSSGQEGLTADWMQASWEAVVEAALSRKFVGLRLVVYGDGADCHARSSRFSNPADFPTHQVVCRASDDLVVDVLTGKRVVNRAYFKLDRFVSIKDGWYYEIAPFDHALIEVEQEQCVVKADRLFWDVVSCEPREA